MLRMNVEYEKGIFIIRLNGSLNRNNSHKLTNYIEPLLKKHKVPYVIINLQDLKEIDETGVDALLRIKCIRKKAHAKLYLCAVPLNILKSLKRLHLKHFLSEEKTKKAIEVNDELRKSFER